MSENLLSRLCEIAERSYITWNVEVSNFDHYTNLDQIHGSVPLSFYTFLFSLLSSS